MQVKSKADARKRGGRIEHFRAKLEVIEAAQILALSETQRSALIQHHNHLIYQLCEPG
jgi:hypothetical protein